MSTSIAKLEEKIAFLEDALQQLSDEHFNQQKELGALKDKFDLLSERLNNQTDSSDFSGSIDEKPPHY